jgi:hypothetical protein
MNVLLLDYQQILFAFSATLVTSRVLLLRHIAYSSYTSSDRIWQEARPRRKIPLNGITILLTVFRKTPEFRSFANRVF